MQTSRRSSRTAVAGTAIAIIWGKSQYLRKEIIMGEAQVAAARSILHRRVKNLEGEELGRVEELMIDIEQGFIAYAVVASADVYQHMRKLFVVPWGALGVDPVDRSFLLDVQQATLENAPGLNDHELGLEPCVSGVADEWDSRLQD